MALMRDLDLWVMAAGCAGLIIVAVVLFVGGN
jgi:hypothetical protein